MLSQKQGNGRVNPAGILCFCPYHKNVETELRCIEPHLRAALQMCERGMQEVRTALTYDTKSSICMHQCSYSRLYAQEKPDFCIDRTGFRHVQPPPAMSVLLLTMPKSVCTGILFDTGYTDHYVTTALGSQGQNKVTW